MADRQWQHKCTNIKSHFTFVQGRRGGAPSASLFSETSAPVANRVTTPVGRWSAGASDGRTGGFARRVGQSCQTVAQLVTSRSLFFFELGRVPYGADRHRAHFFEGTRIFLANRLQSLTDERAEPAAVGVPGLDGSLVDQRWQTRRKVRIMRTGSWLLLGALSLLTGSVESACSSPSATAGSGGIGMAGAAGESGEAGEGGVWSERSGDAGADYGGAPAGDGGESGSAFSGPPGCVPTSSSDSPDDDFLDSNCDGIDGDASRAIFVSPGGSDAADGAFGNSVKTIQHGVELAAAAKRDVYVCSGEYTDNIAVGKDAVSVYGGYDCSDWSRGNARVKVTPPSGPALVVRGATAAVIVDRFELRSADATKAGESSIAAMLVNSEAVTLSNVSVTAGAGATGRPGGTVKPVLKAAPTAASGQDAGSQCSYIDGGVVPSPACQHIAQRRCQGRGNVSERRARSRRGWWYRRQQDVFEQCPVQNRRHRIAWRQVCLSKASTRKNRRPRLARECGIR